MVNYENGRYVVENTRGEFVGRIDYDQYVRDGARLLYRIDGDEIYSAAGGLVGFIAEGVVLSTLGDPLFVIFKE